MKLLTALGLSMGLLLAGCAATPAAGEPAPYGYLKKQDIENLRVEVRRMWTDILGNSADSYVQSVVIKSEGGLAKVEIEYLKDGVPWYLMCDVYHSRNGEGALEFYLPGDLPNHCWGPVRN